MWIVRLALRRPYTFVVMAIALLLGGIFSVGKMPTDIFPEIDIPVIAVVWQYGGLDVDEMEKRVTGNYERALTTTVNGIEHIESQTLTGIGVVKIFFHPGTSIENANAQVTAISQTMLRQFPPGMTPPLIVEYSASNVPIVQMSIHSDTLSEQNLFDLASNFMRAGLATVQGAQLPWAYGGKQRQIMIDLDLPRLYGLGMSPRDVIDAVNVQNLVLPSGTAKLGGQEVMVRLNSSPEAVKELGELPLRTVNGSLITISDVAHVRDGFAVQTSMVHADGKRGVLQSILKSSGASTMDIVARVKTALPDVLRTLPQDFKLDLLFDQSLFVRASIEGVVKEAVIAAGLTGIMILLFLGSWRSTIVVVTSIPLSICVSLITLAFLGHTLNLMTLGGLSLAVGILVDDATVEIENVHRNIGMGKPIVRAILDGAQQIATPAFVATLCICIVFIPVVFISGAAKSLFTPLAMAVVFAMMSSYFLSRTLVPTMVHFLLAKEMDLYKGGHAVGHITPGAGFIWNTHERFNVHFERFRRAYGGYLDAALTHSKLVTIGFAAFVALSVGILFPALGKDFFPSVDAGQMKLHVRMPAGTRIEDTERAFGLVEDEIRKVVPKDELATILDNIGVPVSGINLALGDPSMISSGDGEIYVSMKQEHGPTPTYVKELRARFAKDFPTYDIFFLAPDITTQVLNFGLSAPIDVQIAGPPSNQRQNLAIAEDLTRRIAKVHGAVDLHMQQLVGAPEMRVAVDRVEASEQGLSQRDIANDMLVSLSSSGAVTPNYWLDPKKGVQYLVAVQTPQYDVNSLHAIEETPISWKGSNDPETLGNLAQITRHTTPMNVTHYNVAGTFDVLANVQGSDLGSVANDIRAIIADAQAHAPRGTKILMRGQVQSMDASFTGLSYGIGFSVLLVYFLMVVNFQSWLDPLIILMALPGAVAGIVWMLFATHTTISVPALMGAIMSIGVATSNSILMVTFANDQRFPETSSNGHANDSRSSALSAGMTRLRPVCMTALAMILGMLPMSLGLGEGGEQNAPLGRAVIGGLCVATLATLFFVPVVYSALRGKPPVTETDPDLVET
jgi:multidrug efflux pump subunit AcrB